MSHKAYMAKQGRRAMLESYRAIAPFRTKRRDGVRLEPGFFHPLPELAAFARGDSMQLLRWCCPSLVTVSPKWWPVSDFKAGVGDHTDRACLARPLAYRHRLGPQCKWES